MKVIAGVEPAYAEAYDDEVDSAIRSAVKTGKVHAIGSCGLGLAGVVQRSGTFEQNQSMESDGEIRKAVCKDAFKRQIAIASEFDLPLIVQANGEHAEARGVLEGEGFPTGQALVRAFRGTDEELQEWVQAGSYVSFGGWSTDDPIELCHQVQLVPANRVLVESCAPEETIDLLAGLPARCDQVVFTADVIRNQINAQQLMQNASELFGCKT